MLLKTIPLIFSTQHFRHWKLFQLFFRQKDFYSPKVKVDPVKGYGAEIFFCDVNLPGLSGIECKRQMDDDKALRKKSIPFVFHSTSINQKTVDEAYTKMTVQGFFQKKSSYNELKETIKLIVAYWEECKHPNSN